jgi:hypothetical protein
LRGKNNRHRRTLVLAHVFCCIGYAVIISNRNISIIHHSIRIIIIDRILLRNIYLYNRVRSTTTKSHNDEAHK